MARGYAPKTMEEKKKEILDLTTKLEQAIDKYYTSPQDLKECLKFMGKFYQYSLRNTSLIQGQFLGAEAVGSYVFWKRQGYKVNKGEKGIKILVPQQVEAKFKNANGEWKKLKEATTVERKQVNQGSLEKMDPRLIYKIGHVFDISQTNCPASELPKIFPNRWLEGEIKNYEEFMKSLQDVAKTMNVKIVPPYKELGAAKGCFYPQKNEIALNPRNSQLQNISTLIHELAHASLHSKDKGDQYSTEEKEFQAEMVSYAVSASFGLDNEDGEKAKSSLKYISAWTKGKELKDKAKLLTEVRETSISFISEIEKTFTKEKNQEITKGSQPEGVKEEKVYWYEMMQRPVDIGCQPKGFVIEDGTKGKFGLVAYNRPLTEQELENYGMKTYSSSAYLIDLMKDEWKEYSLNHLKEKSESSRGSMDDDSYITLFNEHNSGGSFLIKEDAIKEPIVLIHWSESPELKENETLSLSEANKKFSELNDFYMGDPDSSCKVRYVIVSPNKERNELELISPTKFVLGEGLYKDLNDQLKKEGLLNRQLIDALQGNKEKERSVVR